MSSPAVYGGGVSTPAPRTNRKNDKDENNNKTQQQNNNSSNNQQNNTVDPMVAALWGVIPVHAKLYPGDMKETLTPSQVPDKHFLVPRQGFLLYHMDSLRAHFSPFASNIHSLWLSIKDKTGVHAYVPWHVPTHVVVDRVMSRQDAQVIADTRNWGNTILPLVVYVHFTLPPALKKKQRPDLAASPEALLTLKDTPGIATLHLFRWLKETFITRFGDLPGLETESVELGIKRPIGLRILKAAKDNDPQIISAVRDDVQRMILAAASISAATEAALGYCTRGENNRDVSYPYCVVLHTFDGAGEKPQFKYKVFRIKSSGRTFGRVLSEIIPPSDAAQIPASVLAQDSILPANYGAAFVQGLQPMMSTPFDVLVDVFQSVDLALHIIWKPGSK